MPAEPQESTLLSTLETLVRWRRLILINIAVVIFAAIVVSICLPRWYRATAVLLPPEASLDPLSTLGTLQMTAATANLPWFATPSDIYGAVLESRHVSNALVEQFDLMHEYRTRSLERAIRKLEKHRWIRVTDEGLSRSSSK